MPRPFHPWQLDSLALDNRIVIAPMCQYSADDGVVGGWHLMHLGQLAISGAGLLIVEATAVERSGRISNGCVALHDGAQEAALARVVGAVKALSPIKLAIQLGHAGRKASSQRPWEGGRQIAPDQPGGWLADAPSALPHGPDEVPPRALDADGLLRVRRAFVDSPRGISESSAKMPPSPRFEARVMTKMYLTLTTKTRSQKTSDRIPKMFPSVTASSWPAPSNDSRSA